MAKGHPNITALFGVFCDHEPSEQEPARPEKPEAGAMLKCVSRVSQVSRPRWCIVMSLWLGFDLCHLRGG